MSAIISVNPELSEWVTDDEGHQPSELRLVLTDKDGELHRIVFEAPAIRELAMLFRGIQDVSPGALGGH